MKEWMSVQEIVDEKLLYMFVIKINVFLMVDCFGWNDYLYFCKCFGCGGGMEYKYVLLLLQV